jgi:hypothetical protein
MAISAPTFFNGIIKLGLDNLEDDFKNSYIGSLLKAQGMDIEDFKKEFEEIFRAAEATATLPEFEYDFDYEEFIINNWAYVNIYVSEGYKMDNAEDAILLSKGRTKGNISGDVKKKPVEEWLNIYKLH